MNKTIKAVLIFILGSALTIFLLSLYLFFFVAYSIKPWKTVQFLSITDEDSRLSDNYENFEFLSKKYPDFYK